MAGGNRINKEIRTVSYDENGNEILEMSSTHE